MTLKNQQNRDKIFLLLSVLLHLLTWLGFWISGLTPEPPPVTKIEVEYTTPEEPAPEAKKVKPVRVKQTVTDQVVEQQKQLNEEKDQDTRFLSAFDQKVIKQTRAERSGQFKNTAQGGKKDEGKKDAEKKEKVADKEKTEKSEEKGELPDLKDLAPKFALSDGPKGLNADNGDPSQSDDYLKDVQSGLQTLLSTREFVYYSYYNRIKESLRQHWEPNVREKVKIVYRKGRNIASAKDRVTQVLVTLDAKGELIKVELLNRSGVEALDDAATEAFKNAAPFPNPPAGMVEKDGTIKIRWDFVLEA